MAPGDLEPVDPGSVEDLDAAGVDLRVPLTSVPNPVPDDDHLETEDIGVTPNPDIKELWNANRFIKALQEAKLEDCGLHPSVLERLRSPPQEIVKLDDPMLRLSLDVYLGLDNASEDHYERVRSALLRYDPNIRLFSLDQVKRRARDISGIYPVYNDMCVNSCIAFVGPFAKLDKCPECQEPRYTSGKTMKARQQFLTNPVGPQIQAAWRSEESAIGMSYRRRCTEQVLADFKANQNSIPELSDWVHGEEYIQAAFDGRINKDTTTLLLSLDGAQLYRSKQSDCWIYIWVLLDRSPETRYRKRHVLIGGVIPGPNKPKNVDSFLFPGLQHLAALMKEGLMIWDASTEELFKSHPFLAFLTADGPGMQYINGLVGHSGRYGCRLYCPIRGRHKEKSGHHYPVMLKPNAPYAVVGSTHKDFELRKQPSRPQHDTAVRYAENLRHVQSAASMSQYKARRLETGIAKPSIISGLPEGCIFGIPGCFPADIMHLAGLNIPELLLALWRGTLACEAPDSKSTWDWAIFMNAEVWKSHGKLVAGATPYLPGSFDRPPRNPAEKISSGYKAVEFLTYLYGLGPALLYRLLPTKYWRNFCRLVRGIRLIYQHHITRLQLREAHKHLIIFAEEFEEIYYQRNSARIHFPRQSIHGTTHTAPETFRVGPYVIFSQNAMERAIGDLGGEIRQASNPYANLSQRALRRCETNALKHMVPNLEPDGDEYRIPRGAHNLDDGYVLLRATEQKATSISTSAGNAIRSFFHRRDLPKYPNIDSDWLESPHIARWARLRLPNGQIARSLWKEGVKSRGQVRISRNVKACVRFYDIERRSQIYDS